MGQNNHCESQKKKTKDIGFHNFFLIAINITMFKISIAAFTAAYLASNGAMAAFEHEKECTPCAGTTGVCEVKSKVNFYTGATGKLTNCVVAVVAVLRVTELINYMHSLS